MGVFNVKVGAFRSCRARGASAGAYVVESNVGEALLLRMVRILITTRRTCRKEPGGSATLRPGQSMSGAGLTRMRTEAETAGEADEERFSSVAVAWEDEQGERGGGGGFSSVAVAWRGGEEERRKGVRRREGRKGWTRVGGARTVVSE